MQNLQVHYWRILRIKFEHINLNIIEFKHELEHIGRFSNLH